MTVMTDFDQVYQQAETAYTDGHYEDAAALVVSLVEHYPDDPRARLLCGNIYCYGLHEYEVARQQYEGVLHLTEDAYLLEYAQSRIEEMEMMATDKGGIQNLPPFDGEDLDIENDGMSEAETLLESHTAPLANGHGGNGHGGNGHSLDNFQQINTDAELDELDGLFDNPFDSQPNHSSSSQEDDMDNQNPFARPSVPSNNQLSLDEDEDLDFNPDPYPDLAVSSTDFTTPDNYGLPLPSAYDYGASSLAKNKVSQMSNKIDDSSDDLEEFDDVFASLQFDDDELDGEVPLGKNGSGNHNNLGSEGQEKKVYSEENSEYQNYDASVSDEETLLMSGDKAREESKGNGTFNNGVNNGEDGFDFDEDFDDDFSYQDDAFDLDDEPTIKDQYVSSEEFDAFPAERFPNGSRGNRFDSDIPGFSMSSDGNGSGRTGFNKGSHSSLKTAGFIGGNSGFSDSSDGSSIRDEEMFSMSAVSEAIPTFTNVEEEALETTVTVEQGSLAFVENARLITKNLYIAAGTGLVSLIAVAFITNATASQAPERAKAEIISYLRQSGWLMTATAGLTSFGTALGLGWLVSVRHINKATEDLQSQFDAVSQGNLGARANIFAEDEFGQLANKFNRMAKIIVRTTTEAQRKADEQEQAKEDLQRQVIRLLDDVEGAARGDLTVQAEVTADVLGAVADSFNLTIQNLREIVQQVKVAARQVSKGATESELFARGLSSDALRQAEELAATLNSVQVLTDAIQRVAESAREAEEVARAAAATAAKGGEAVERTVAGILDIRETVAETTRKVKRLAESTQEISKIVALISAIASRTNLLALNASIEAARAGESGRGFALVADQVRQLADRSAKSLKEIEQIVMQIQSETGQVMTAMEEGTQQVIEGTKLAEQAKRSLEDIIQVTNRIDVLVRSITADTVEQNETARAVASVMQAVELTAQETSQEAQKVSVALQNLVGVARDLLTSVERFRVEASERH